SRGKAMRAEPISLLYEKGRVLHRHGLDQLEGEMMAFSREWDRAVDGSPNRLDAMIWGITRLSKIITHIPIAQLSPCGAIEIRLPLLMLGHNPPGRSSRRGSRRAKRKVPLRCRLCRNERLRRSGASFWWAQVKTEAPTSLIACSMCRACGRPQEETLCRNKIRPAMMPPSSSSSAS